jgi:hypothetical protein
MFSSRKELARTLQESGYVVDTVTTNTIYLAAKCKSRFCSRALLEAEKRRSCGIISWLNYTAIETRGSIDFAHSGGCARERNRYPNAALVPVSKHEMLGLLGDHQAGTRQLCCNSYKSYNPCRSFESWERARVVFRIRLLPP